MAATMKDIAKKTGLGLATISSYFNGGNVRKGNRIKIEAAIEELHFEVNEVARGLKTNRTHTVGVVIPELSNIFCAEIITGMEDILRNHGYAVIVCDCRTDKKLEQEAVEFLLRKRVDGLINMPVDGRGEHLKTFVRDNKPIVLIDREIPGLSCDAVLVDNRNAAKQAVSYLIACGHSRIGMIAGPEDIYTARERLLGYKEALKEAGIQPEESLIAHGDYTIKGAVDSMKELRAERPDMTAVFAANYEMTMGTMIYTNEHTVRVPEELSVIGFDHVEFAKALNPPLTIVTQPTRDIASHVAELILRRMEPANVGWQGEKETIRLQTKLWMGKSVRKEG